MQWIIPWGSCQNEHEYCIVEIVSELLVKGYSVYLECETLLNPRTRERIVVDIYARKEKKEIIVEVGSLSEHYSQSRLRFLKSLYPHAKVIHVTQWKNWISQFDWQAMEEEYYFKKYIRRHETQRVEEEEEIE